MDSGPDFLHAKVCCFPSDPTCHRQTTRLRYPPHALPYSIIRTQYIMDALRYDDPAWSPIIDIGFPVLFRTHRPITILFPATCVLSFPRAVQGSASWRIPLGVQLIPGIALAIGCIFLPPSPRLLVAQGRNDEALRTLAKLRLRSEHEVEDDLLLQVSMRVRRPLHLVPGPCVIDMRFVSCPFSRSVFPLDPC